MGSGEGVLGSVRGAVGARAELGEALYGSLLRPPAKSVAACTSVATCRASEVRTRTKQDYKAPAGMTAWQQLPHDP